MGVLIRNADRGDGSVGDVRVGSPEVVLDADGGAVLPGLHDHHIHLLATAAARESVDCARSVEPVRTAVPRDGWIRGVGYAGTLDRAVLDALRPDVPVRVQHRGGSLWTLNSAALDRLGPDLPDGVERDAAGRPTGRLWRLDGWLRSRVPASVPDLAALGRILAAHGVTGVTDATPHLTADAAGALAAALPQRLMLLGVLTGAALPDGVRAGPWKVVVSDHDLPSLDALGAEVRAAHDAGRAVAVHAVTREALLLVLAALDEVGSLDGDRIEHAAIVPPGVARRMAALGLTVVTQPSLPARRGDDYLARVEPDDVPCLWPYASLLTAGVRVGLSSDAPYGDPDPWASVRAATSRVTASGAVLGADERVPARVALGGYLSDPSDPGGPPRPATGPDLVVLDRPLRAALDGPPPVVRATVIGGALVYGPGCGS